MIASANGTISTEQPESGYVHTLAPCVAYHEHFDGEGEWLACREAQKRASLHTGGRVLKNSGHGVEPSGPVNLPR